MNDLLRQKLCDIVAAHGAGVADDPPRCAELLRQAAPEDGAGVEALLRALKARVPARLALLTEPLALAPLTSGLVRRLVDEQGLSQEAAHWAIESWAVALGKGGEGAAPLPGRLPAYDHILAPPRRSRWRVLWYLLPLLAVLAAVGGWWWAGQRSEVRRIADRTDGISSLALSADGRTVLAGCGNRSLRQWDVGTGAELMRIGGLETEPFSVAISPDGRLGLTAGGMVMLKDGKLLTPVDCAVRLWDLEAGRERLPLGRYPGPVHHVAFAADGRRALACMGWYEYKDADYSVKDRKPVPADCVVRVYDLQVGEKLAPIHFVSQTLGIAGLAPGAPLGALAQQVAAAGVAGLDPIPQGVEVLRLEGHKDQVWCAAFTPDGQRVVSAAIDGTVRLWDAASGRELKRAEVSGKARVFCMAVSPDGRRLLTGDNQSRLTLWDLESLEIEAENKRSAQAVHGVAFSPDGQRAVSGGDDFIVRVWNVETLEELRHYPGHTASVTDVAFLPDGRHAVSSSYDGTIRVWRLP